MANDHFTPGPDTERAFRDALGCFGTGVTVVTTMTDAGPVGMTANSFASVSLDPPLVLWSPARASKRFGAFEQASNYAIHVLSTAQADIAVRFARDGLAFDGLHWSEGVGHTPLLPNCLARFECRQSALHNGGDHAIIVGEVLRAATSEGDPLLYSRGHYGTFSAA